jgi:TatD DNase family protein
MWIDSHCHLNHKNFGGGDPAETVAQARDAGVDGMVNISCQIRGDFPLVLKTAQDHENVWCTVGTHPHDAGKAAELAVTLGELLTLAKSDSKIIGIGESGLDYYYDFSPREEQMVSFRKHIQACLETDMPLIVHARDADADIIRIMREEAGQHNEAGLRGVMHCFSSGAALAAQAVEFGFYLSFSGILTFKAADELRSIAKNAPLDRVLVETDAPFLAPVPYRGKMNIPAYVTHTGKKLAALHDISPTEMARITTKNFFTLFDRVKLH